ncbi:MAG: hypothetical protein ACLFRN_03960 [Halothece sp.]
MLLDGLRIIVIAFSDLGLALGRFPRLRMNRTTITIALSVVTVTTQGKRCSTNFRAILALS